MESDRDERDIKPASAGCSYPLLSLTLSPAVPLGPRRHYYAYSPAPPCIPRSSPSPLLSSGSFFLHLGQRSVCVPLRKQEYVVFLFFVIYHLVRPKCSHDDRKTLCKCEEKENLRLKYTRWKLDCFKTYHSFLRPPGHLQSKLQKTPVLYFVNIWNISHFWDSCQCLKSVQLICAFLFVLRDFLVPFSYFLK